MSIKSEALNGTFNGISLSDIQLEVFKNVKYANIPHRWAHPERIDNYEGATFDCTQEGVHCPQIDAGDFNIEHGPKPMSFDEFECDNLMITRPHGATNLPVFVWIHGGGNMRGNGYSTDHNPIPFVKQSIASGRPVVQVSIAYRLGMLGYLAVPDKDGKLVGNWGARDQYVAMEWITRHISEFGGDPKQVTIGGESAGSVGLHALMVHDSQKPKEDRIIHNVILSSGTLDTYGPGVFPLSFFQLFIDRLDKILKDYRTTPVEELLLSQNKADFQIGLYADDDFFQSDWRTTRHTVSRVWLSDVVEEGTLFKFKINEKVVPDNEFDRQLFQLYDISPDEPWESYHYKMMLFKGDQTFGRGNAQLDKLLKEAEIPVWRQLFDQIHPNDPTRLAHHAVDLYYMWNSWEFPEEKREIARKHQDNVSRYVYGEDPWPLDKLYRVHEGQFEELEHSEFATYRNVPALEFLQSFTAEELGPLTDKYIGEGDWTI